MAFNISTKVLHAQAEQTLIQLQLEANQDYLMSLSTIGIKKNDFVNLFKETTIALADVNAAQERAKLAYEREAHDDRAIAEEGYRLKLELQARLRLYAIMNGENKDFKRQFRVGKLRTSSARAVSHDLRIILPELVENKVILAEVGIDDAFIARARSIHDRLFADQKETEAAKKERILLTQQVIRLEEDMKKLLLQLESADEIMAYSRAEKGPVFPLTIVRTEQARLSAEAKARLIPNTSL